jgi:hypothetical protein
MRFEYSFWRRRVSRKLNVSGYILFNIFDMYFKALAHYGEAHVRVFHSAYLVTPLNNG